MVFQRDPYFLHSHLKSRTAKNCLFPWCPPLFSPAGNYSFTFLCSQQPPGQCPGAPSATSLYLALMPRQPRGLTFWYLLAIPIMSLQSLSTQRTPHRTLWKPFFSLQLFKRTGRLFYICLDSSKLSETNLTAFRIPHIAPSKKPDNAPTRQRTKLVSWPIYRSEWCRRHQSKTAQSRI